jgi:glycosyltransferase involved in cell wall biosynthesis
MTITTTRKKVLFFVPSFPVLTETFIEVEIRKLVERNNLDVWILALDGDGEKLPDSLKTKVIYKRLGLITALLGILFGVFRLDLVLDASKLIKPKKTTLAKSIFLLIKYLGYTRIISKVKPDLLVSHFLSEPSTLCMFASRVLSVPYGISAHAKDVTVESEYVPQKMATANFVLVCNKNAQKSLIEQSGNVGINKMILQYHGVEVKKNYGQVRRRVEKSEKPLVVSVGRLIEKKGHTYLIEASKILKERGVVHLINIIGPGPMYDELNEKIAELDLVGWVEILGNGTGLSHKETLDYLGKADICIFSGIKTAQGDEDGIPNVLFEYASMNVPIVTTDTGSTTDFIENEKTGLVIPQKDSYLLADAIEKLIFNKELCSELTKNAFQKVNEEFNIDKNIVKLEKILL